MEINIRKAAEQDAAELQELYRQVDALHHHALPHLFKAPDQCRRTSQFIREELSQEDSLFLVAEMSGQVVGFVVAEIFQTDHPLLIPNNIVHISEIVVDEHFYGRGAGQRLVGRVKTWAQERNVRRIQLQVFEFNQRAISFYEEAGFTTASRRMWHEVARSPEESYEPA